MFIQEAAAWNGEFDIQGPDCHQRCRAPGDEEEIEGTMTTGHDDTGRRDGGPNLLAPLPGDRAAPGSDPAGSEALLTAVLEMREEQARFRKEVREELAGLRNEAQADRPETVTRDALEAWGERLLKRFDDADVPERAVADDGILIVANCAARMTDAAREIEEGAAGAEKRLTARIGAAEEALADRLSAIDATKAVGQVSNAAGRIETELAGFRNRVDDRFNHVAPMVTYIRDTVRELKFTWRIFIAPWALGMFAAGFAFAIVTRLVDRLS